MNQLALESADVVEFDRATRQLSFNSVAEIDNAVRTGVVPLLEEELAYGSGPDALEGRIDTTVRHLVHLQRERGGKRLKIREQGVRSQGAPRGFESVKQPA